MQTRPRLSPALMLGAAVVASLAGCPAPLNNPPGWADQVTPAGPCYDANLLDGLDETSTDELHQVYGCLNGGGALDGFVALDEAWDTSTRDGLAGLVVARWVNGLGDSELPDDLSLSALVEDAVALVEDPEPLLDLLHVGMELVWATPWSTIGSSVDPADPAALDAGLLPPILPVVGDAATVLLDDPGAFAPLADALRAPVTRDLAWTVASVLSGDDPALAAIADNWPDDLALLLERTTDASNDRWAGASGDSLRDVAVLLVVRQEADGRVLLSHVVDPILPMLGDPIATTRLRGVVEDAITQGRLPALPTQVLYLMAVDARGGALDPGEDSALLALLRLLATTNQDLDCGLLQGNLAVTLLSTFADLDPDTAVGGLDLLGGLLGIELSDVVLEGVAATCPALDEHFVDDIHAIDRLVDPAVDPLLRVLLAVLDAIDADTGGETDHIPALVDTVTALWSLGLVPPVEEALRDALDTPLVARVIDLVPVLLDPDAHHDAALFPSGVSPLGWDALLGLLPDVLGPGSDGVAPLDRLQPVMEVLLAPDGTWTAVHRLGALLGDPRAELRGVADGVPELLADDPYLTVADDLAATLDDPSDLRPILVLVEGPGLRDALLATSADAPGALPTLTLWTVDGTLDVLLSTLRQLLSLLPETE